MPIQIALLLLRLSGLPRLNYLIRSLYPDTVQAATQAFDRLILSTFSDILHMSSLPDAAREQLHLPIRLEVLVSGMSLGLVHLPFGVPSPRQLLICCVTSLLDLMPLPLSTPPSPLATTPSSP